MQRSSAYYQNILAGQRAYNVVYLCEFEGISTRFCTGPVTAPQGPTKGYMITPTGAGAQVTPDQGSSSLATLNVDLVDYNQEVTALMRSTQFANLQVTVKQGFLGMPEASYLTISVGLVLTYQLMNDNLVWRFQLTTLMSQQQNNIFDAFCTLVRDAGPTDTTIYVDSTDAFPAATNGCCYLFLGNEAISYTSTVAGAFLGCTRAQLGTTANTGSIGDQPQNLIFLQGPPLTLALQIMMSTGTGTNGPYDVLPACAGLAIPQDQINVQSFLTQQTQWLPGLIFQFEESSSVVGQDFLEEQLFTFSNCYPLINNDGLIDVHVYGPAMPQSEVPLITDDDMIGAPTWSESVLDRYFFNEVDLEYDYDFISGEDNSQALYEDSDSQLLFGRTVTWQGGSVESRGMRTAITGLPAINAWANRILQRFGGATAPIKARFAFSQVLVGVGDIVPITSRYLPDLSTGTVGVVAHLYEVIEQTPDYANGVNDVTLLDTGYTYGKKYCAISPAGYPNFSDATPQEKLYGFICQKVSDSSGIMGDGSPGYLITQ